MMSTSDFCVKFTTGVLAGKNIKEISEGMGLKQTYVQSRASALRKQVGLPKLSVRAKRTTKVNLDEIRTTISNMVEANVQA